MTISSNLGEGDHSHAEIIVEDAKYTRMTGGTASTAPANPGLYPNIAVSVSTGTRAREEVLHKGRVKEYKIFCGVEAGVNDINVNSTLINHLYIYSKK